ncbi:hypothetical protein STIAU_3229 [Stigmatella aurantiaca DW4/3-1]|nr:hypothetical protein STIAU_3229 [Stigmatella aurantiaca DW4/3-1]
MGYWLAAAVKRGATQASSDEASPPRLPLKERDALVPGLLALEEVASNPGKSFPDNGGLQEPPDLPQ